MTAGLPVLIALDEEHALGVAADHSVTVVGDKDDLGGRRAVRHINGAIVISIGQIDGGNVRNTDVRLDGVRSLIVDQERGLAVGIGRTVLPTLYLSLSIVVLPLVTRTPAVSVALTDAT